MRTVRGGVEVVREVRSAETFLATTYDREPLERAIRFKAWHQLHDQPTMSVAETWEWPSDECGEPKNSNGYWHRLDRDEFLVVPAEPELPAMSRAEQ